MYQQSRRGVPVTARWVRLDCGEDVPGGALSSSERSLCGRRREQSVSHQLTVGLGRVEVDVEGRIGREGLQVLSDPVEFLLMT
jgi:hypothetical protein